MFYVFGKAEEITQETLLVSVFNYNMDDVYLTLTPFF